MTGKSSERCSRRGLVGVYCGPVGLFPVLSVLEGESFVNLKFAAFQRMSSTMGREERERGMETN